MNNCLNTNIAVFLHRIYRLALVGIADMMNHVGLIHWVVLHDVERFPVIRVSNRGIANCTLRNATVPDHIASVRTVHRSFGTDFH